MCIRDSLYNMSAVRLFSFVLAHRDFQREGQIKLGFGREFSHEGNNFKLSLKTRGYRYNLPEPIPVHVLEGRVRGDRKSPIDGYIAKPIDVKSFVPEVVRHLRRDGGEGA